MAYGHEFVIEADNFFAIPSGHDSRLSGKSAPLAAPDGRRRTQQAGGRTRSLPTPMGEPSAVNSDARPGDERCVVAG